MTEGTRFEIIRRFVLSLCRAVFVKYFYLTLVILGLAVTLLPVFFPERENSPLLRAAAHIGAAILTAGAVTTFMRFFASLDIVGERIGKWLGSEEYLSKLSSTYFGLSFQADCPSRCPMPIDFDSRLLVIRSCYGRLRGM